MTKNFKHDRPTIGVLVGWQVYEGAAHGFFTPVFRGIQAAGREWGCNLLLACGMSHATGASVGAVGVRPAWPVISPDSENLREGTDFVPVGPWNADGLIAVVPLLSAARSHYLQQLLAEGYPVVFVGAGEPGPAVVVDNQAGIAQVLLHLIEHGHRRIAYIAGYPSDSGDSGHRFQAYQSIVQEHGLAADPRLIAYGRHSVDGGELAMQKILKAGVDFTAVLASNDESAVGALRALQAAGLRVPEDVALAGFDDRLDATAQLPPLTTAHYPFFESGSLALGLLLKYLRGEARGAEIIKVPTRLVIRQSCGCLPGNVTVRLEDAGEPLARPAAADTRARLAQAMTEATLVEARQLHPDQVHELSLRLVETFVACLEHGETAQFRWALRDLLQRIEAIDDEAHAWQAAISVLEGGVSLLPESRQPQAETRADEMLRQARIAISESARRRYSRYAVLQNWVADQVGLLIAHLLTAQDEAQVFDLLAHFWPGLGLGLGIRHAQVVFFEPEGDDPVAWSVLRVRLGSPIPAEVQQRFPSRDFPPEGLYPAAEPFHLALLPLILRSQVSGFVAFDAGDLGACATIVRQIGAALESARSHREAAEGRRLAEEANRLKSRLLSTVSHELRTPLNLIVGLSEILLREQEPPRGQALPHNPGQVERWESYREDVEQIHISAQHLDGLIRDVLDLARSEVGQLKLTRELLDLSQTLDVVINTGERLARGKGLEWRVEIPESLPSVMGDQTRLRQVLLNLVSNAVKFTAHGRVTLEVKRIDDFRLLIADWKNQQSTISNQQSAIVFSVSDTGLGIPPEEQAVIFDEFRQSERTATRGYGGLGLGLAICKRLVELHGGQIGVESSGIEGSGSRFYFTLPLLAAEEPGGALISGDRTVLFLANQFNRDKSLRDHLRRQGFTVEEYSVLETPDWLERLIARPPGAVVLDQALAAERGWEILKVLKSNSLTQDIPVLFYSLTQEQAVGSLLELDYLMKPVGMEALAQALGRQGWGAAGEPEFKTVLVVDDDPAVLDLHARMVQSHSPAYRILKARHGREALEIVRQSLPDLVLLDLMMPEVDGFQVLETMRRWEMTSTIPVIVLTGQILTEEDMARLNRGVATVLGKGLFTSAETLAHVAAVLERNRKLGSEAQRLVRKAMAYVHEHYAEGVSREGLARYVGVSKDYLTQCFRQELRVTPMVYLNRYRINRAKALLAEARKV